MLWSSGRRQALRRVPRDLWLATRSPSPAPNRNRRKVPGHHKGRIARKGTERRRAPIDYREGGFNQGFHDRCGVSSTLENPQRHRPADYERRECEPGLLRHHAQTTGNHRVRIRLDDNTSRIRERPVQPPYRPKLEGAGSDLKTTLTICPA